VKREPVVVRKDMWKGKREVVLWSLATKNLEQSLIPFTKVKVMKMVITRSARHIMMSKQERRSRNERFRYTAENA